MFKTLLAATIKDPQSISFQGEDKDEKILYVYRKSVITNIGWVVLSIILIIAPIFLNPIFYMLDQQEGHATPLGFVFIANLFWFVITAGFIFERFLNWYFNVYMITDKRIIDMDFSSILHRSISEAPLRNIEDITHSTQGTWQVIFNYGDVSIQTAAEKREFDFESVPNPAKVQDILSDLVAEVRHLYGK